MPELRVELVSPERISYSGAGTMVIARTIEGDIAFLPGHVPFIGVLATHPVRVLLADGSDQVIAVHQGFIEVSPGDETGDTRVTILSDVCELSSDIDVERAQGALERATAALSTDPEDSDAAAAALRAEVRLSAAGASVGTGGH